MRKLILFCLFISPASFCFSQVHIGVKSGINIATTRDLITFPKNRLGWYAGGFSQILLTNKFFFQPELNFSSKGYRYVDLSNNQKVAMRLNYLEVPLLLGYEIDTKTKIVLGPDFGYLLKAIDAFNNGTFDATNSFPRKFDFSVAVGVAYNIIRKLGAEVRYCYGFKNMYQVDNVGIRQSDYLAANRAFQLGLYYSFHFK